MRIWSVSFLKFGNFHIFDILRSVGISNISEFHGQMMGPAAGDGVHRITQPLQPKEANKKKSININDILDNPRTFMEYSFLMRRYAWCVHGYLKMIHK